MAKGAAASVSAVVFVALVVHAQWGCDAAGRGSGEAAPAPAKAPAPAEAPAPALAESSDKPVAPQTPSPSAEQAQPAADRGGKGTPNRKDANAVPKAVPKPYLSSSKSDPDMWARDFRMPSSTANQAPEARPDR